MKWPETFVQTPKGAQPAIAPLVISASRATDIPAFHAAWFMKRLEAGYCVWTNPFNVRQRQRVSFEKCRVLVFWSKNPAPIMPYLREIESRGLQFYFQFTLNNYEREGLEPGLPALSRRLETFRRLSDWCGPHRVVWRFDPIVLGSSLCVEVILERLFVLAQAIAPHTEKLVFSFVDWYPKTARRLARLDPAFRPPSNEEMIQLAQGIADINRGLLSPLVLATCAEALDLHSLGIEHNRCIDPELLVRLCPEDEELRALCGATAATCFQKTLFDMPTVQKRVPVDRGQRKHCGCVPSKDIGTYNTCRHFCAYCYANRSPGTGPDKTESRP